MAPIRTGLAFAITVGLFYALCTLVWALAPAPFLTFMNNLFHGMDFNVLVQPKPFSWWGFITALLVLTGWALAAGTFFAWLSRRFSRLLENKHG